MHKELKSKKLCLESRKFSFHKCSRRFSQKLKSKCFNFPPSNTIDWPSPKTKSYFLYSYRFFKSLALPFHPDTHKSQLLCRVEKRENELRMFSRRTYIPTYSSIYTPKLSLSVRPYSRTYCSFAELLESRYFFQHSVQFALVLSSSHN